MLLSVLIQYQTNNPCSTVGTPGWIDAMSKTLK